MHLASGTTETLLVCASLTLLAACFTVILSVLFGAIFAYHARPTVRYAAMLALMFVPFAMGGSVWAYAVTRLAVWCGLQGELVVSGPLERTAALLFFCLARAVPLGTFFCTTTLQRYTAEIRPYFQAHRLRLPFFLLCAFNRIPKSILMLLGLFGGALMAAEAALPLFLYRANPGTGPETVNLMLSRLFREIYASVGPDSLSQVATLGLAVSLMLLLAAFGGAWIGRGVLAAIESLLRGASRLTGTGATAFSAFLYTGAAFVLLPGVFSLAGLLVPALTTDVAWNELPARASLYQDIVGLGLLVSVTITAAGMAIAVRLRYARKDWLALLERRSSAAALLLLPAFLPVLTIIAILGWFSGDRMTGFASYVSLFVCHAALHFSIFQFICMTLIAAIPERHVAWQRVMGFRYSFSLSVDGFKRHAAVMIALVGLGVVQVVSDGSIARWFSHLVKAPEEALYAAVFGRLSSVAEASLIAWSVALVAMTVCGVLAAAYAGELRSRPRYA